MKKNVRPRGVRSQTKVITENKENILLPKSLTAKFSLSGSFHNIDLLVIKMEFYFIKKKKKAQGWVDSSKGWSTCFTCRKPGPNPGTPWSSEHHRQGSIVLGRVWHINYLKNNSLPFLKLLSVFLYRTLNSQTPRTGSGSGLQAMACWCANQKREAVGFLKWGIVTQSSIRWLA